MPISPSGAVSFSDLRTEFIGGSGSVPMGGLYRGGSNIRAKAGNNQGTNLAANVPTTGALDVSDFYGQAKGFKYTYSAGGTDQNASTLFGDDYAVDYPKEILIPSSVTLGTNNTSEYALEIDSGASGTITVTNNGSIIGAGGAGASGGGANSGTGSSGSAGGDAIKVASACTFVNNGSILAGGGGGGGAGGGGRGGNLQQQQQTTAQQGPFFSIQFPNYWWNEHSTSMSYSPPHSWNAGWAWVGNPSNPYARWNGTGQASQFTSGQYTYKRGPFRYNQYNMSSPESGYTSIQNWWRIYRTYPQSQQTQVTGHNGGAGGAGGLGRGYNNQPGGDPGSGGSAGSTGQAGNGGAGGTGGAGGGYGSAGSSGASGATGSPSTTGGSGGGSGGSGGAAGLAVERASPISFTFTNNGTVAGTVQS